MPLAAYQFQIGTLVLGPGTSYDVLEVNGLGIPDVRADDIDRPLDHGSFYSREFLSGRQVTLKVGIAGDAQSAADAVAKRDTLLAQWAPVSVDAITTKPLQFDQGGVGTRQLLGRPRRVASDVSRLKGGYITVTLEYVSGDPRIYGAGLNQTSLALALATTGRSYNKAFNYGYGSGSSGTVVVINAGTFPTRPVVTFSGPVTNPFIENQTAGTQLDLQITLAIGDVLTVDFDARTILLGGTASRYSAIRTGSVFWELAPGANSIRFGADVSDPAASASVAWRDAWI